MSRTDGNTLWAFTGEGPIVFGPITPRDIDETVLDTTSITLEGIIETLDKTDILIIGDGSFSKTSTEITITVDASANASESIKRWAVRRTDTNAVIASGEYVVEYKPKSDVDTAVYVSGTGSDTTGTGTQVTPYATLAKAVLEGAADATIRLERGTTMVGTATVTNQTITTYGAGADPILTHTTDTTLNAVGTGSCTDVEIRSTDAGAVTATVTIGGSFTLANCYVIANDNKALLVNGDGVTVEDCVFDDSDQYCAQIVTFFDGTNCTFRRNKIERTDSATELAMYSHGSSARGGHTITQNLILGTATTDTTSPNKVVTALKFDSGGTHAKDTFSFNRIEGYWEQWINLEVEADVFGNVVDLKNRINAASSTIAINSSGVIRFVGNSLLNESDGNTAFGLIQMTNQTTVAHVIKNNLTWYGSIGRVYASRVNSASSDWDYNCYFGSTHSLSRRFYDAANVSPANYPTFAQWQANGEDVNGFESDPTLKSTTDFWPVAGSPLIDAGTDITGLNERVDSTSVWPSAVVVVDGGSTPNIGAFETGV